MGLFSNSKGLILKEIGTCEVCEKAFLIPVLDIGVSPLCDDLIPIGNESIPNEYPIEILLCPICSTAHQRYQVPREELFMPAYHYRARMTGSVLQGMKDFVDQCEKRFGNLDGMSVLDIGCNDGSLLNIFRDRGCKTLGIEPTDAADDSNHHTIKKFFDVEARDEVLATIGKPDIITFTNVFAHIDNLNLLLENLRSLIGPQTKIVIENHYLGAVLKYGQFDTFYHEHPRTYSAKSFEFIAKKLGLILLDVEFVSRYGGNIRAYLGRGVESITLPSEIDFEEGFTKMNQWLKDWIPATKTRLRNIVQESGKLPAKAFPGRASIILKVLDLDETIISEVYEIHGSQKVGHYVPGTRIPILPERELFELNPQPSQILNLAWHIPSEVQANLVKNGYTGKMIDLRTFEPIL
jgi:SAM-dependent methyltransferase